MPSIFTHPVIPIAIAFAAPKLGIQPRLLFAGVFASILPDADVVSLLVEGGQSTYYAHRGFTHSMGFSTFIAALGASMKLDSRRWLAFWFLFASTISHPLLDAMTNAGRGSMLLWPLTGERFFLPFRPIEVSPIGIERFFTERGLTAFLSELRWVWLPCFLAVVFARMLHRTRSRHA
jgi:inner membrane protein